MVHFDAALGRYPYTGFKAGGERPIGATRCATAASRWWWPAAATARARRASTAPVAEKLGRRPAGDRRELRAHLPPERRQHRPVHLAPTSGWSSASSAARRSRSTNCWPAATRWPRRSCAPAGCCAYRPARSCSDVALRRRRAPMTRRRRTLFEKIVARHTLRHARHAGALRRPAKAASCAPTGASSTSTTPACARTCWQRRSATAAALHEPRRHRRLRGPPVLRGSEPGARAQRPDRRTCSGCRGRTARSSRATACIAPRLPAAARSRRRAQHRIARHLARDDGRALRAAGAAGRRHRFAHAAQRRARLRRLRRRHHRHGQRVRHRRRAPDDAASRCASSSTGPLPAGVTAKDVVLHLLALPAIRAGAGVGKVFEFGGDAVRALSTDERATLTNMTAELGGFTGIVEPDDETVRFLRERRGIDVRHRAVDAQRPRRALRGHGAASTAARLSPMVAAPGDPGNGVPLRTLRRAADASTSPTAARAPPASARTSTTTTRCCAGPPTAACACADGVQLYLQFGTDDVRDYCERARLPGGVRGGRRADAAAGLRRLRQLRPRLVDRRRPGDGERDQPQLPRPLGPGVGLAREPAHRGGQRDRRAAGVVRRVAAPRVRDSRAAL